MGKLFMLLGIPVITRRRVQRGRSGQGGARYDNSPTSKIYTTWARVLSNRNVFYTPRGGGKTAGVMPLGLFLLFSFWWSLAPDLRSVKTILAGNLHSFSVISPEFS